MVLSVSDSCARCFAAAQIGTGLLYCLTLYEMDWFIEKSETKKEPDQQKLGRVNSGGPSHRVGLVFG